MNRNPLYLDTSVGGLTPVDTPDQLDPAIIPTLHTLLEDYTNYNAVVINSANHLKLLTSEASAVLLPTDYEELLYRVIAYDSGSELYYLAEESVEADIVGLCLGVIDTPGGDCIIIQLSGLVTPLLRIGNASPTPITHYNWYLQTNGELYNSGTLRIVAKGIIDIVRETQVVKQAITQEGLGASGLTVTAQPGLTVTIGDGITTHRLSYNNVTNLTTLAANTTKRLYINPSSVVTASDRQYLVVPYEMNLDNTTLTMTMNSGTATSGMVITGSPSSIRATTNGTWVMGYASNTWTIKNRYQYYQFTYAGGTSNNMFGMIGLNPAGVWSGAAYFAITTNTKTSNNVYLSWQAANPTFAVTSGWTLYHTAAISNANSAGAKTYRVLVDQVDKLFYLNIDGTWLNSGQPIAKYNGSYTILPAFCSATTSSFITFAAPSTFTPPAGFAGYQYYNKANNSSYTYDYSNPAAVVPIYSPTMYLGEVVAVSSSVTINSPPVNNTYEEYVVVNSQITLNHKCNTLTPSITINCQQGITYSLVSQSLNQTYLTADATPTQPTPIVVTL